MSSRKIFDDLPEVLGIPPIRSASNFSPPLVPMVLAAVAVVLVWSSVYTIPAESEGVVLRFGKYIDTVQPGLHAKLPFGMDQVSILPTRRQLKMEFGFYTPQYTNQYQIGNEPDREKAMVTGDLNAALVEWVVQYRINEPKKYLFDVRDPAQTLRDLSEAAMREVVGDRTVDEVITVGRQEIEIAALSRLQELVAKYQLGVVVDQVQLKNVNPPQPVQASFNEVNKAQQDRENMVNVANGEYNKAVPRAKGEADSAIQAAEGYRFKRVNEAEGDVASFSALLAEYRKAPDITRTRMYLETMAEVLPRLSKRVIVDESLKQWIPLLSQITKDEEKR
jgi:membrane protease subunit HflK